MNIWLPIGCVILVVLGILAESYNPPKRKK